MQEDKLTIGIPKESLTDTALENLQKIIANKQTLFQRAFRTDNTEIEITEEKINFTWFSYTAYGDVIAAYTQFISRLCDMARDAKRVSSKPTETDNDIYRVQMPNITPHVCRHTYCSNMAKSGMNPKTLQYPIGHSDISVTMNVYTHIGFDDAEEELKRMEEFRKAQVEVEQKKEKPMSQKMFKVV